MFAGEEAFFVALVALELSGSSMTESDGSALVIGAKAVRRKRNTMIPAASWCSLMLLIPNRFIGAASIVW
jgi:hypothetical protein